MLWRTCVAFLALSWGLLGQNAPVKPIRLLFIGNSYTYFNNLPKLVEAVAASQKDGPKFETEASLRGGMALKWHWDNGAALEAIRKGGWDFVILQEHSLLGNPPGKSATPEVNDPATFFEYAQKFDAEIKKAGAKTVLYATWSRDGYPEHSRKLDEAFTRLARQIDAAIIPTGLAWTIAKIEAPGLKLHMPDRSHPTMTGSYLNALAFYQCLTGRNVVDPPTVITGPVWNNPKQVTLVQMPWSDAVALNQIAQRACAAEPLRPHR
jgi:hypothetical protein